MPVKDHLLRSLFGGLGPRHSAPLVRGDLIDSWVFADLSLRFFMGKSKQKELKKIPKL